MGFASLQLVHPLRPAYHLFVDLAGPVLSKWRDLAAVEIWHQAVTFAGLIQALAGRDPVTGDLVPLEAAGMGPITIVPVLLATVDKGLAAEVHVSLEQVAGAISNRQSEIHLISLVSVQGLVLVGLSCEASSTLQNLSYIQSLSLRHKLRATHMDSVLDLTIELVVIAHRL